MHAMRFLGKVFTWIFVGDASAQRLAIAALVLAACVSHAQRAQAEPPLEGVFAQNFVLTEDPVPVPSVELKRLNGETARLTDFRGEVVLLNFWATWCAPCLQEMPSLERLAIALGDRPFRVIAVSTDRGGGPAVKPFLKRLGLETLTILLDSQSRLAVEMGLRGLPTTYLLDREGRVLGGMQGPAEWDSPEARALVDYYLEPAVSPQKAAR